MLTPASRIVSYLQRIYRILYWSPGGKKTLVYSIFVFVPVEVTRQSMRVIVEEY